MQIVRRAILYALVLYLSWLGMMFVHELGHVLHALLSSGKVISVSIPFFGFSLTTIRPNPYEHFVVWGGAIWGVMIPMILCGIFQLMMRRVPDVLKFFTGLCLVANGAYLGIGWTMHAGDAKDLIRLGTPTWLLIISGAGCVVGGFVFWHRTKKFL